MFVKKIDALEKSGYLTYMRPEGNLPLRIDMSDSGGDSVNIYTFDSLTEPLSILGLRFVQSFPFYLKKVVLVNEFGESVVLFESVGGGLLIDDVCVKKGISVPLTAFNDKGFEVNSYFLELGVFKIFKKSQLIIEFSCDSSYKSSTSTFLELVLGGSYSDKPYYLKTTVYNITDFSSNESFARKNFLKIDRKDYDVLGLSITYANSGGVYLDGRSYLVDGLKSFDERRPFRIVCSSDSVSSDVVSVDIEKPNNGVEHGKRALLFVQKRVYNRETFLALQYNLEAIRKNLVYDYRNDFANVTYKTILGIVPKIEDIDGLLTIYAQFEFNDRNKGYYDTYVIPVDSEKIVSGSGGPSDVVSDGSSGAASVSPEGASVVSQETEEQRRMREEHERFINSMPG